jgi:hypothetical protein
VCPEEKPLFKRGECIAQELCALSTEVPLAGGSGDESLRACLNMLNFNWFDMPNTHEGLTQAVVAELVASGTCATTEDCAYKDTSDLYALCDGLTKTAGAQAEIVDWCGECLANPEKNESMWRTEEECGVMWEVEKRNTAINILVKEGMSRYELQSESNANVLSNCTGRNYTDWCSVCLVNKNYRTGEECDQMGASDMQNTVIEELRNAEVTCASPSAASAPCTVEQLQAMTFIEIGEFCNTTSVLMQMAEYLISKGENLCVDDTDCEGVGEGSKCIPTRVTRHIGRCTTEIAVKQTALKKDLHKHFRSILRDVFGTFSTKFRAANKLPQ